MVEPCPYCAEGHPDDLSGYYARKRCARGYWMDQAVLAEEDGDQDGARQCRERAIREGGTGD